MKIFFTLFYLFLFSQLIAQDAEFLLGEWVLDSVEFSLMYDEDYSAIIPISESMLRINIYEDSARIIVEDQSERFYYSNSNKLFDYQFTIDTMVYADFDTSIHKYLKFWDFQEKKRRKYKRFQASIYYLEKLTNGQLVLRSFDQKYNEAIDLRKHTDYYFSKSSLEFSEVDIQGKWFADQYVNDFYIDHPDTIHLTKKEQVIKGERCDYLQIFDFRLGREWDRLIDTNKEIECKTWPLLSGILLHEGVIWKLSLQDKTIVFPNLGEVEEVVYKISTISKDEMVLVKVLKD